MAVNEGIKMRKTFKFFTLILASATFLVMAIIFQKPFNTAQAAFIGDGSSEDPYIVETAEELQQFAQYINAGITPYNLSNKHFKLIADIDLSNYGAFYNDGKGWTPVGIYGSPFKGIFDGNGHKITGLYINDNSLIGAGLFGDIVDGTVKDVALINVNINAYRYAGGITGYLQSIGKIEGCYVTGTVKTTDINAGGIAGSVSGGGMLKNCYTTCDVSGKSIVGGIAGNMSGSVAYCYAAGNISGTVNSVGGIIGSLTESGTASNCAALNFKVSGDAYVRRITGHGGGVLINNYALSTLKDKNGTAASWEYKGLTEMSGADISLDDSLTAAFWEDSDNWNGLGWDITNGWIIQNDRLPELVKFGKMTDNIPDHYRTDILNTDVIVAPNIYVYTGGLILPNIKVTLTGSELESGFDYTYSITSADGEIESAGKNVGIVSIEISGAGYYKGALTQNYTIIKANPTFTVPNNLAAVCGDDISSVVLPEGFTWESEGEVGKVGTHTFKATFTPTDTKNYNVVTGINITVTVNDIEKPANPGGPNILGLSILWIIIGIMAVSIILWIICAVAKKKEDEDEQQPKVKKKET